MGVFLNLRRIPSYCQGHFHFCEIADCIVITYRHLVHHKTKSRSKTHVLDLLLAYRNLQFLPRYKINPNLSPIGNKFGSPCFGGDEEDRTLDLTDANRTLSQLSYAPTRRISLYHRIWICKDSFSINSELFRGLTGQSVDLIKQSAACSFRRHFS